MLRTFNRVMFLTETIGDGDISIGGAAGTDVLTPDEAGAEDGDETAFVVEEGGDFAMCRGTIGGSVSTLTIDSVVVSKISGISGTAKMDLSGGARVRFITDAELANSVVAQRSILDELLLSVSMLALQIADNANVALFPSGNRVADSFDALTYVDVAGATNLNTSAAGLLKPAGNNATTTGTFGGSGGTPRSITTAVNFAIQFVAPSNGVLTGARCTVASFSSAGTYEARLYTNSSNSPGSQVGSSSGSVALNSNGDKTFTFSSPPTLVSGTTYWLVFALLSGSPQFNVGVVNTGGASYRSGRHNTITSIVDDLGTSFSEDWKIEISYTEAVENVTVRSTAFPAAAAPSIMRGLFLIKEIDAATPGTDYTIEFSRDDGGNWEAATLTEVFTSPSPEASIIVVQTNDVDVSGQPSGTSLRWQWKTLTNKMIENRGAHIYWE